jgi:hypothetical protein
LGRLLHLGRQRLEELARASVHGTTGTSAVRRR